MSDLAGSSLVILELKSTDRTQTVQKINGNRHIVHRYVGVLGDYCAISNKHAGLFSYFV